MPLTKAACTKISMDAISVHCIFFGDSVLYELVGITYFTLGLQRLLD